MHSLIQIVLPRESHGSRAHSLSHKALLLYGLSLLLVQLGLSLVSNRFPGILGFASNIRVEEIIDQTNNERSKANLPAVKVNEKLTQAATLKANYMFAKDFWAHLAPDGTTPWKFILDSGYRYLYAGENLAKDFQSGDDVVKAWMDSKAGHRENVLGKNYTDIGVAVVNGTLGGFETTIVVQMFGSTNTSIASKEALAQSSPSGPVVNNTVPKITAKVSSELPTKIEPKSVSVDQKQTLSKKPSRSPGVGQGTKALEIEPLISTPLVPLIDVVALAKNISFAFGFFLLALFLLDSFVVFKKGIVRISGHNGAHILVLLLLIGSTWFLNAGVIR